MLVNILAGLILLGIVINILSSEIVQVLIPYIVGGLAIGAAWIVLIGIFVTYAFK